MQPIPLKWSAPRRCYFLFATLMFSSNPLLFLSLSLSLRLSLSPSLSPLLCLPNREVDPLDQSPLHPVVPRSRLIVRNLWYRQTFSTVFAVSFLFIPSPPCYLSSFLFFLPPLFHSSLFLLHSISFSLSLSFLPALSIRAPIEFLRLKCGHTNLTALSNRDALDPV